MSRMGMDDFLRDHPARPDLDNLPRISFRPLLAPEALYGLPGRIVEAIQPHTEPDPVATLVHLLVGAGNLIGDGPQARGQPIADSTRLNVAPLGTTPNDR